MQELVPVQCPNCGEAIELLVDCSVEQQEYIEDCQVCCRPIQILVGVDSNGHPDVSVSAEND
ncbi:MAG: CPXCG motif-containing cysteine-rich protein [Proteobacteria bacterium]|nr:CPXCG motif-containing cysteine-rich protein [Pseudomonadota bacterium]